MARTRGRPTRRRDAFAAVLGLGLLAPAVLAGAPARAATETFSESFTGATLGDPGDWVSTNGPGGTGPTPASIFHAGEPACLTGLAPGLSISVGSGEIAGCPDRVGDPATSIDAPGSGVLRLTDNRFAQSAVVLYDRPQRMSDGLDISFSFAIHSGVAYSTATGADGFSFFIKDGANGVDTAGASGGALGYALSATGVAGSDTLVSPGVPAGLLGVGFDFWGNHSFTYSTTARISRSCGAGGFSFGESTQVQDRVVLRGPDTSGAKDGSCGYEYIERSAAVDLGRTSGGVASPGVTSGTPAASRTAGARRARIVIDKPRTGARVKVYVWPVGEPQPATPVLDEPQPAALEGVETFKFGFGASTGWATNVHEIWGLQIVLADPVVQAEQAASSAVAVPVPGPVLACAPDPVAPGAEVACSVTSGPADGSILWRAVIGDGAVDTRGVVLDGSGDGAFTFRAPADADGTRIDVELVDWGVRDDVGVVGDPVPAFIPAGGGPVPIVPMEPLAALLGVMAVLGRRLLRRV